MNRHTLKGLTAAAVCLAPVAVFALAPPEDTKAMAEKATLQRFQDGLVDKALKAGQAAPDFALPDVHLAQVQLSALLKKGPVVLTFYRGGWCPFCNIQLKSYQEKLGEMRALGAELVAVSPQRPDESLSTADKAALTFKVLSDAGNAVARQYGLVYQLPDSLVAVYKGYGVDLEKSNGDTSHELPLAGTFIIGKDGKVLFAFVNSDYKKRLPVERILEVLKAQ